MSLSRAATENERLRFHANIHESYADPCQRLFIAMHPRSYVIPHRHTTPAKSETFVVLRGSLGLVFFDDQGGVRNSVRLGPNCEAQVCDIPTGVWHTAISFEDGSVFLEFKPGPYCPYAQDDIASWAPAYGSPSIDKYLDSLYRVFEPTNFREKST